MSGIKKFATKAKAETKVNRAAKNKWTKGAKQRSRAKKAKQKLSISTKPTEVRTLKKSARAKLREVQALYQNSRPWIGDPSWKYMPVVYPKAGFLGLPQELRQRILELTLDKEKVRQASHREIGSWIGTLCIIKPIIRMEMDYVANVWKHEKREQVRAAEARRVAKEKAKMEQFEAQYGKPIQLNRKKPRVIKVGVKKKRTQREQKCWYCEQRHFHSDPVCPPAREDAQRW